MSYTKDQLQAIQDARSRLEHQGRPEVAAKMDYLFSIEAPYDEIWAVATADVKGMVRPEKDVADIFPPPPTTGTAGSTQAWRRFAKKVSDIEPEIIDSMGRNDLIRVLADRDIIPLPEFILGQSPDTQDTEPTTIEDEPENEGDEEE